MTKTSLWAEFGKKTLYAVVGLVVAALVSFLNSNPTLLGSVTVLVAGILSMLEEKYFPTVSVEQANLAVSAAASSNKAASGQ